MGKNNRKKHSGQPYTKEEVECIKKYMKDYGVFHDYESANSYQPYHLKHTGKERSGHALYMFAWRVVKGKYD